MAESVRCWGALFRSANPSRAHLIFRGCTPELFRTKREAKLWIDEWYGYVRTRADLRKPPHSWRMPRPVRVKVSIEEAGDG